MREGRRWPSLKGQHECRTASRTAACQLHLHMADTFAKALSELPRDTVLHCWAPLQPAYDNMTELHAKAAQDLPRLFPNM